MTTTLTVSHQIDRRDVSMRSARWPKIAAVTYVGAWVAGLTTFGAAPTDATDAEVSQYFTDHRIATALQSLLVHGVAAVALFVVLVAVRRVRGANGLAHASGVVGVTLSLVQFGLGMWRSAASTGSTTTTLVDAIDRIDGAKMLAFAVMIGAAVPGMRAAGLIGRRTSIVAGLATVSLVVSGVAYATAIGGMVTSAAVSLVLLLAWVTLSGIAAARRIR